ncbi:hypothetical protein O6H91_04G024500 [Diphasiastrum complanatum]|uniref:Uncharacterized protein n=3 Tax=Diphasiastrum complanatum TaxID=34168 RepID=A0ACC2DUY8_DIPCM|nr:hypothetical protein O6H91_04G024500 [Diphasiastrum complanatum]KAJ7558091.1 hypothetical protein O6H91_04G024500 [Diphasiastrum complanatum]KAJ7558092.1 hypothetical protein O6H91_04G024500 [Diphasiastrum complanatum]
MEDLTLLKLLIAIMLLFKEIISFQALASTFESDVTALQAIKKGWQATNLNWNGDDPCGSSWRGVSCDQSTSTLVKQLSLSSVGLNGRLLPSVSNLINLESLDLSFNPNLTGPIPDTIGSMIKLKSLNLQGCGFIGSIPPSLGILANLSFFALNGNQLIGEIPFQLGGLGAVTWFDVSENLLSGALPVSSVSPSNVGLNNLSAVQHLHLNNNTLFGLLPKEICSLPKLIHLLLDSNNFSGVIPAEISQLSNLQILRLDDNKFEGEIPSSINKLASLSELHLSNNNLNGSLPNLSGLQELMLLRLSQNMFDPQAVPTWIVNLTKLQTLEMDNDSLTGAIPPSVFDIPYLETLSFQSNNINGRLQFNVVTSSLTEVSLENNNITDVGGYSNSDQFQLLLIGNPVCSDNRFNFSSSICSQSSLASWVRDPSSCTTTCPDSKILNPLACTCAFPLVLQFQFNAPSFADVNTTRMHSLETQLEMAFNLSTQQVVAGSANFTEKHRLLANVLIFPAGSADSLSQAQVSNIISQLSLQSVSLTDFGPFIVKPLSQPPSGSKSGSNLSSAAIVGICIGAVGVFIVLLCIGIYAVRQKRRADKAEATSKPFASWGAGNKDSGSAPNLKGARWFPFTELKSATSNFSDSNQIGAGGYGKVYKGTLVTGEIVAIKRAQQESMQGAAEFKNEIELLSRVHHRNLVGLIGFCYEQGEQMLVYEYMPNGTLREHILGKDGPETFDWTKRLEIALGSAKGLSYLHELANPPIIHRDVKSANILLDEKLVAKVADFGLSKLVADGKGHVSTQVKGTMGYLDPEYYMTQQLSEKSDVYSFGVVLLELITARQPIERGKYIVREVRTALDKGGLQALRPLLDPSLRSYPNRDMESYLDLSLRCVEENASRRPSMSDVAKELEGLLISTGGHFQSAAMSNSLLC